jgi:prepilin peptidase CpaA
MIILFASLVIFVTSVMACVSDVRFLRIPNSYVCVVIAAFLPAFLLSPESFGPWWHHLAAGLIFLVITYIMFCCGMLGGGDAKLGAALALFVGLRGLVPYLFYMALVGGLLGALAIVIKKKKPFTHPSPESWAGQLYQGRNAVPYGIAISFGAWAALFHTGFADNILDELIAIIH